MYIKDMLKDAALEVQYASVEDVNLDLDKALEVEDGKYVTMSYRVARHNEDKGMEFDCFESAEYYS